MGLLFLNIETAYSCCFSVKYSMPGGVVKVLSKYFWGWQLLVSTLSKLK